jgi:hypothetical protein
MMVHATLSRREAGRSQDPAWGTDLQPITMALETLPDDTPVSVVIGERKRAQLARLADAGIRTLGDARTLCLLTAAYCGTPMRDPPEQIDAARAALGSSPTHRCRGVIRVEVSRGAVDIDIDGHRQRRVRRLLVGCPGHQTVRLERCLAVGYYPFCAWDPIIKRSKADCSPASGP